MSDAASGQNAVPKQPSPSTAQVASPANFKPARQLQEVAPPAERVEMKRRHRWLVASFFLAVLLPLLVVIVYLLVFSIKQYESVTGFTVRQEESGSASELLGGLANFAGNTTSSDSDILSEFIKSQEIVSRINSRIDLVGHYEANWRQDPVFSLWPDASIEDLTAFWERTISVAHDQSTGLIEVSVRAFDPSFAKGVAEAIVDESQKMINDLNAQARADAMRYAIEDLDQAVERVKVARASLANFRTRTQIVDPDADIQGRMGVMNNLQQQLAEALIEYDLLLQSAPASDPRLLQTLRRTEVIRERIWQERQSLASSDNAEGGLGADYPSLIAEYESLLVDRQIAEETYAAALQALDIARNNAQRQSRYLATYIQPTLSEDSEYPRFVVVIGLSALFLVLFWSIAVLIFYSVRDRG